MTKVSLLFFLVCVIGVIDQTYGNYYWQNYAGSPDLASFAPLSAVIQPDCDKKKKESSESSSSSSSSSESSEGSSSESKEGESSSSSSSSSSEESKSSSKESGEKAGSKEGSKEEKEGSKEQKEGSKEDKSSEESKEKKKEAPKKKRKSKERLSLFPPRAYSFPARQVQQIVYSAAAPYAYLPYRSSSYVVQQPVASYQPLKSSYQYVSLPSSASLVNAYRPQVSRVVSSPLTKILYSSAAVPSVSKSFVAPASQVYSAPVSWSSPISFLKK